MKRFKWLTPYVLGFIPAVNSTYNNRAFTLGVSFIGMLKGIVKRAEQCKCDICLLSWILWHKRIIPSLKRIEIGIFDSHQQLPTMIPTYLQVYAAPFQWRLFIFIRKNLWCRVLETNKKEVTLKSYSLKIRIDSVNQILKNKEKVT